MVAASLASGVWSLASRVKITVRSGEVRRAAFGIRPVSVVKRVQLPLNGVLGQPGRVCFGLFRLRSRTISMVLRMSASLRSTPIVEAIARKRVLRSR